MQEDYSPTKVMLLGMWHFAYYNLDSHKTDTADMIDIKSPQKQEEILEVVNRLKAFNPTIICVESKNQKILDSLYQAYISGTHSLSVDEEEQLGFRVAKEMGLKKLHAVDVYSWLREHYDSLSPEQNDFWNDEYEIDTLRINKWHKKYDEWYTYTDKFPLKYSIDHCLKINNHPENLKRGLGHYLVQMSTSNDSGADAFSLKWYDRNVRIFNNILNILPKEEDRILVIFGEAHIAILQQLFDVSPQFELVSPYKYEDMEKH